MQRNGHGHSVYMRYKRNPSNKKKQRPHTKIITVVITLSIESYPRRLWLRKM